MIFRARMSSAGIEPARQPMPAGGRLDVFMIVHSLADFIELNLIDAMDLPRFLTKIQNNSRRIRCMRDWRSHYCKYEYSLKRLLKMRTNH
jgi:hypothetical protein